MAQAEVILEREGPVATLVFNRPQAHNAVSASMAGELERALLEIKADRTVRALILTGAGEKSFVSGSDIKEMSQRTTLMSIESSRWRQSILDRLEGLPIPSIAALNGYTFGIGCEVALACTFRLASEKAKLGQLEINLGIIPGAGGTQRLPRLIGRSRAAELILSGRIIDAEEALSLGLVNKVLPPAELLPECRRWAETFAGKSPVAVEQALRAINQGCQAGLADGLTLESYCLGACFASEDAKEGLQAFVEKRKPRFKGC